MISPISSSRWECEVSKIVMLKKAINAAYKVEVGNWIPITSQCNYL